MPDISVINPYYMLDSASHYQCLRGRRGVFGSLCRRGSESIMYLTTWVIGYLKEHQNQPRTLKPYYHPCFLSIDCFRKAVRMLTRIFKPVFDTNSTGKAVRLRKIEL